MPKIRIREMMGKPAVPRVSLGSEMLEQPREFETITNTGEKITQYRPGRSRCNWLEPGQTADVSEDFAKIVCDDKGICERVAGRPKRTAEEGTA